MTTVDDVLVRNLKRLRATRGWSQAKLADAGRAVGLDWGRGHVAAIENGSRRIQLSEAVALLHVFETGWDELVQASAREVIELTPGVVVSGARLPAVLRGEHRVELEETTREQLRAHAPTPEFTDADRKAARNVSLALGSEIEPDAVVQAAATLWGRSFQQERDARAADGAPPELDERAMQARRAHASRELYQELVPALAPARTGVRTKAELVALRDVGTHRPLKQRGR